MSEDNEMVTSTCGRAQPLVHQPVENICTRVCSTPGPLIWVSQRVSPILVFVHVSKAGQQREVEHFLRWIALGIISVCGELS